MPELILASTSPTRKALLSSLGIPFRCEPPGVDETLPEPDGGAPMEASAAVALLAERKARAVAERYPDALVLGSDQLASLDGALLGKPPSREAALAQLTGLSGRTHQLFTGVCLLGPGHRAVEVDRVDLTVHHLSPDELERYVDTGEWEGCAGGYRVEGRGGALFEQIDGDRTSVMGLPLLRVVRLLREAGWRFYAR